MRKVFAFNLILFFYGFFKLLAAEPPASIPPELYAKFTLNYKIPVIYEYRNDSYPPDAPLVFNKELVDSLIEKAKNREIGRYGILDSWLYSSLDDFRKYITGKEVAILGSVYPWYESIILAYKGHPITIDYNKIIFNDERINFFTVEEYNAKPKKFDVLVSISSFEHDGLGRYGDPINPNGDLETMEKCKKMLKKNGILILSIPVGPDCLVWNLHRIYGKIRLPKMLKGWKILATYGFNKSDFTDRKLNDWQHQPVFVLKPE